ncbi:dTDP-4-dehydrorhamnose 3,5-epimerase [bacterium E08(2017)]|nr:dTDP-4-dehydrorhamnose 3,5-epimerase [bacterium E08(2017)]
MADTAETWKDGNIEGLITRPIVKHSDDRGWLAEIFRTDETDPEVLPVMTYLSITKPGIARGPHAHSEQTDTFAFPGPGDFKLSLWDNRSESPTYKTAQEIIVGESNPAIIIVPPGVVHGYRNISDHDAWVINCPNRLFAGEGKKEPVDEIRYEDDPDSPFSL